MSFSELHLHPSIRRNLSVMGYHEPRPIQAQAIGPMLEGRDVIGLAPTGTGKTAAFLSPIAHHLLETPPPSDGRRKVDPGRRLRALVLCPTRELAIQVAAECSHIIAGTVLRAACVYGKVGMKSQREAIERGIDILIATPGRVRELLDAEAMTLAHVRCVAIDEADRMLDMGFLPQVTAILEKIPAERQTVLFTATMPDSVDELARRFLNGPLRIEIGRHTTPVEHVEQHLVPVAQRDKVALLLEMLPKPIVAHSHVEKHAAAGYEKKRHVPTSVVIFCRTRRRVGWVGAALQRHGIGCGMIHGDRTQAQRLRAVENLASGRFNVIVCTDVAARGLHIPAIRTVINYDVPPNAEEYVHRIGRAAHGGGRGEAWTLLAATDRERWEAIERQLQLKLEAESYSGFRPSVAATSGTAANPQVHRCDARGGKKHRRVRQGDASASKRRTSCKSRPIRKGEKPGRGARRPSASDRE